MKNAFSVDFEDWYHGIELPYDSWSNYENRIEIGLNAILELLNKYNVKATFFVLGWISEKYPHLIRQLSHLGHELGSHGYTHEKVYNLSKDEFRNEICISKKRIEDLTGNLVTLYRAPYFSITSKNLWALDILAEEGYKIDSSISPVKTWRYGIPSCPDEIFKIKENGMIEFPISTFKLLTKKWAIGGAYFRIFPYSLSNYFINSRIKSNKRTMFYIHPWEYDPQHPVIDSMEKKAKFTHYFNLDKTFSNTESLLKKYNFDTLSNVIGEYEERNKIKEFSIQVLGN